MLLLVKHSHIYKKQNNNDNNMGTKTFNAEVHQQNYRRK